MNRRTFIGTLGKLAAIVGIAPRVKADDTVVGVDPSPKLVPSVWKQSPARDRHDPRTCYWTGNGNWARGDWNDSGNWRGGIMPRDGDTAVLTTGFVPEGGTKLGLGTWNPDDLKDAIEIDLS